MGTALDHAPDAVVLLSADNRCRAALATMHIQVTCLRAARASADDWFA